MNSIFIIINFLSWEPEKQVACLPGLAKDSGSRDFTFDIDNPALKVRKVVHDLAYQREGEAILEWRQRQGLEAQSDWEQFDRLVDGVETVFDLMAASPKESLFTEHGIRKASAWRLVRMLARQAKSVFSRRDEPSMGAVADFFQNYQFDE